MDKIGAVIGPGGRTLRGIEDACGVEIDIDNRTGETWIKSASDESLSRAREILESLSLDPEPGRIYRNAKVVQLTSFGAFVEFAPKRDGLLHVSEWAQERVSNIADVVKEGDLVDVMVLEVVEGTGKVRLSRKAVLAQDNGSEDPVAATQIAAEQVGGVSVVLNTNGRSKAATIVKKEEGVPTIGRIYRNAKVVQVTSYGAFVQLGGKRDGLLHVSEWSDQRVANIGDFVKEGDMVDVIVIDIMDSGKVRLSRKALIAQDASEGESGSITTASSDDEKAVDEEEGSRVKSSSQRHLERKQLKIRVEGTESS